MIDVDGVGGMEKMGGFCSELGNSASELTRSNAKKRMRHAAVGERGGGGWCFDTSAGCARGI